MSLKTILVSTLLAATAIATDYGSGGGSSYGGGGSYGGGSGDNGWSSWSNSDGPPGLAAASCPAGCVPFPTGGAPPPMPTQSGQLIVQVVSVSDANGSLKYFPDNVQAPVGSIVQFQYHPKNHTITESSFAEPCKPVAANVSTPTRPGLRSGFVPVTGMEPFTPVFNVLINDTKPIWIFCGQTNHCQKGMAMVINQNATSGKTIEAYIAAAAQLPLVSTPPPPAGAPPPPAGAPPPPPPPASSPPPFGFGGGAPPPAVATVTPPASSVAVAPATFTGAAVHGYVPQSSTGVVGLVLGALLALW